MAALNALMQQVSTVFTCSRAWLFIVHGIIMSMDVFVNILTSTKFLRTRRSKSFESTKTPTVTTASSGALHDAQALLECPYLVST